MMLKIFYLIGVLQAGDFKERKLAEHYLKISPITYEFCKNVYKKSVDPELKVRIKRIAYVKYVQENVDKYRSYSGYFLVDLRRAHFKEDWKR